MIKEDIIIAKDEGDTPTRGQWDGVAFSELPFINQAEYKRWREDFDRQKAIEDQS